MTVITTFSDKQRKKRWAFERKVLRQLSLADISEDIRTNFRSLFPLYYLKHPFLEDPCIDVAIDAFLLGAEYSRFGYYGESNEDVRSRCYYEINELISQLFELLQAWTSEPDYINDSLSIAVDSFVNKWWTKGFSEGKKRYQLRLH